MTNYSGVTSLAVLSFPQSFQYRPVPSEPTQILLTDVTSISMRYSCVHIKKSGPYLFADQWHIGDQQLRSLKKRMITIL
jgi:hypothetical protein